MSKELNEELLSLYDEQIEVINNGDWEYDSEDGCIVLGTQTVDFCDMVEGYKRDMERTRQRQIEYMKEKKYG